MIMGNKIIIFSASTGQGHNQAAKVLLEEFIAKGYDVEIIEPFKETSKSLDLLVSDGYKVLATKLPKMYGGMYKLSNIKIFDKGVSKLTQRALHEKIYEIIELKKPCLVISTHPLIVKTISALKQKGVYSGPFLSVITDYIPHESYISDWVDGYVVGSQYTKAEVIRKGVDADKVHVHGIPIKREFHQRELSVKRSEHFTILLMGGSMGLSSMKKAYKSLLTIPHPLRMIVVCGQNTTLKKYLDRRKRLEGKVVETYGFTPKIAELMEISDILISKPGGLTVSEALAKNIPMIIPFFIPGQEEENAEVLADAGGAVIVDSIKELDNQVIKLIENPEMLVQMKKQMEKMAEDHSLDDLVNLGIELIAFYRGASEK